VFASRAKRGGRVRRGVPARALSTTNKHARKHAHARACMNVRHAHLHTRKRMWHTPSNVTRANRLQYAMTAREQTGCTTAARVAAHRTPNWIRRS
jgi:hypothetical protein